MNRQRLGIGLLLLALLALGWRWWQPRWEKVEVKGGLTEAALADPWLAARQLLAEYQVTLRSLTRVEHLYDGEQITVPTTQALIVYDAAIATRPGLDHALWAWVKRGGQLTYVLSPQRQHATSHVNHILLQLGVQVRALPHEMAESGYYGALTLPDGELTLNGQLWAHYYFDGCLASPSVWRWDTQPYPLFCQFDLEAGQIELITSVELFSNQQLAKRQHASLLVSLYQGRSELLYLPGPNRDHWLMQLWQWGGAAVLAGMVTLLAGIWHLAYRFGPIMRISPSSSDSFHRHITALGRFYQQHGHAQILQDALLEDIHQVMARQCGGFKQMSVEQQCALLAQRSGMTQGEIAELLQCRWPVQGERQVDYVRKLKQLRETL